MNVHTPIRGYACSYLKHLCHQSECAMLTTKTYAKTPYWLQDHLAKRRRCKQDKTQEHFRRERTYAYVTEKSAPATPYCEVYTSFAYSTVPAPSFSSTSASFTDTIFDTPFSCIVTPNKTSAWFIVGFLCVITINCVFSEKFFK